MFSVINALVCVVCLHSKVTHSVFWAHKRFYNSLVDRLRRIRAKHNIEFMVCLAVTHAHSTHARPPAHLLTCSCSPACCCRLATRIGAMKMNSTHESLSSKPQRSCCKMADLTRCVAVAVAVAAVRRMLLMSRWCVGAGVDCGTWPPCDTRCSNLLTRRYSRLSQVPSVWVGQLYKQLLFLLSLVLISRFPRCFRETNVPADVKDPKVVFYSYVLSCRGLLMLCTPETNKYVWTSLGNFLPSGLGSVSKRCGFVCDTLACTVQDRVLTVE